MATNEIQEICFLWGDWQIQRWWSCMSRAEWAAWAQAFGVFIAIFLPYFKSIAFKRKNLRIGVQVASNLRLIRSELHSVIRYLKENSDSASFEDLKNEFESIDIYKPKSPILSALNNYDAALFGKVVGVIDEVEESINRCKKIVIEHNDDIYFLKDVCSLYLESALDELTIVGDEIDRLDMAINAFHYFPNAGLIDKIKFFWWNISV